MLGSIETDSIVVPSSATSILSSHEKVSIILVRRERAPEGQRGFHWIFHLVSDLNQELAHGVLRSSGLCEVFDTRDDRLFITDVQVILYFYSISIYMLCLKLTPRELVAEMPPKCC